MDVLGLIIGVAVLAASAHDNAAGTALLDQAAERCGNRLEKALVDQGFKDQVVIHGALLDINAGHQRRGRPPQPRRPGQRLRPPAQAVDRGAGQRHADAAPSSGARVRPPPRHLRLACLLGRHREHGPPSHHTESRLARHHRAGRVNITETALPRTDHPTERAPERRPRQSPPRVPACRLNCTDGIFGRRSAAIRHDTSSSTGTRRVRGHRERDKWSEEKFAAE